MQPKVRPGQQFETGSFYSDSMGAPRLCTLVRNGRAYYDQPVLTEGGTTVQKYVKVTSIGRVFDTLEEFKAARRVDEKFWAEHQKFTRDWKKRRAVAHAIVRDKFKAKA